MLQLHAGPVRLSAGRPVPLEAAGGVDRSGTIAYGILSAHDRSAEKGKLSIRFDSLISHDITYVGIIQTASASGLTRFPVPYVLTNCHNSLCAVGGTINADDHAFGLSAARRYGGVYVPANMAVIHQYAREELAGCGRMVLGSDSHTRYGALGTMGVGEGGPELVKQLLGDGWESAPPQVVLVWLTGTPRQGVGPHDVAIALCTAVYKNNFVKNKVLEFAGPGVAGLPMDYRIGVDVMTTETACLSSVWQTDGVVEEYYAIHGRPEDYRELRPAEGAEYDAMVEIDLSAIEPMAALPFHPSEGVSIHELQANAGDWLREIERRAEVQFGGKVRPSLTDKLVNGRLRVEQGVIAGCSGGMFDNLAEAAAILDGHGLDSGGFELTLYPPSIPVELEMLRSGLTEKLTAAGALLKPCFCGPCFGAGDVPSHNALSVRHTTRNFPNREGSRPGDGQFSGVLLMDARSIAATARCGGVLTAATDLDYAPPAPVQRRYDRGPYEKRVYFGYGKAEPEAPLQFGPNIVAWPPIPALPEHLLLSLASVLHDPVTTTDELIPSGETSSYRSNPLKLASFALSRRDPAYVGRTAAVQKLEADRAEGHYAPELRTAMGAWGLDPAMLEKTGIGSALFAEKPGDGSAREQAASCQRVLGGAANICREYATKRYRSNCINWGMLPFTIAPETPFDYEPGDLIFVPDVRKAVTSGADRVTAKVWRQDGRTGEIALLLPNFTPEEREIVLKGCLMNWYKGRKDGN